MPFRNIQFDQPSPLSNSFIAGADVPIWWSVGWIPFIGYTDWGDRNMDSSVVRVYRNGSLYHEQSYGAGSWCEFTLSNVPEGDYTLSLQFTKNGEDSGEVECGSFIVSANPPIEVSTSFIFTNQGEMFTEFDPTSPIFNGYFNSEWQNVDSVSVEYYLQYADGSFSGLSESEINVGMSFPIGCVITFRSKAIKNGIPVYGAWQLYAS